MSTQKGEGKAARIETLSERHEFARGVRSKMAADLIEWAHATFDAVVDCDPPSSREWPVYAGTAATLVREWNKAAATPELNPAQKAAEQLHAERALRVAWGGDYESNLKLANAEVTRIATAHPNLPIKAMLASTSLGNSVYLIRTLVNRAQAAGRK